MKRIFFLIILGAFLFSSCTSTPTPQNATPTQSVTVSPIQTQVLTATATLIPTPTLSPDLNRYECAENVSKEDCDFIKDSVRIARYSFLKIFGRDIKEGVKFKIINDPSDLRYAEGGTSGAFIVPNEGEPFVWINVGHPLWIEYSAPEYLHNHVDLVVHEFFHAWQWQQGCTNFDQTEPTFFMIEGYARYIDKISAGVDFSDRLFSDEFALSFWQATEWNENEWFHNGDVTLVLIKHLVEEYGIQTYLKYCDALAQKTSPNNAFQTAYGISVFDFRAQIKDEILGNLKDCTVATCGAGVDNYSDKYKLGHLLDPNQTKQPQT